MVSQSQDGEWDRSGSMLSLDGRQRPPMARTPPSYYDAVRSRHSLSQPVSRQADHPSKQDRLYLPQQEKYNSLPRPLPQRCAAPMTNGHDKSPPVRGGPWTGSPPHPPSPNSSSSSCVTAWKAGADRSCPPRPEYHEYSSPPGPANSVPQVHQFPPRTREGGSSHHLHVGTYPGRQQQRPELQQHYPPPHFRGEQQSNHHPTDAFQIPYGDPQNFPAQYIQKVPQQRVSYPGGPRLHPPPPPPVTPMSPPHHHHPPPANSVHYPMGTIPNGVELRRSKKSNGRDPDDGLSNGRFVRRSYPVSSEDYAVYGTNYYRSQSQDQIQCQPPPATGYDPRYTRSGTLPMRPTSRGSEPLVPVPAVAVRTGPLGTYPESRPVHMDQLPPPSTMDLTSNGSTPGEWRGSKPIRNSSSEEVRIKEAVKPMPRPLSSTRSLDVLLPNGASLRKTPMTASNASLCSEASTASSRLRRPQTLYNSQEELERNRLAASPKNKMTSNDPSSPRKQEKNAIFSPSPWAREEKEQLQRQQVQGARRARDEEIEHLENLPNRTKKQDELLRILRLEREFQRRAEEMGDRDEDEEEDEELLDRAEHMERMLMMQEEIARSRAQRLQRTPDHSQQLNGNSNDDWAAGRKIPLLSRIAEENGENSKDSHLQKSVDLEQLSDLLDSLSTPEPHTEDFSEDGDHRSDEMRMNGGYGHYQNPSKDMNGFVHNSRRQTSFPVPAPRASKASVPPPVAPKSKSTINGSATSDSEERRELGDETPSHQTSASVPVRDRDEPNVSQSENGSDLRSQTIQVCANGTASNGFAIVSPTVSEVDIANLYASSKMRNGYVDSRKELQNSPELKKLWNSRPEKLTFMDKIRKFSLQAGEGEVPKDKVKNSRAQREIESKFSESQKKCATIET